MVRVVLCEHKGALRREVSGSHSHMQKRPLPSAGQRSGAGQVGQHILSLRARLKLEKTQNLNLKMKLDFGSFATVAT